MVMIMNKNNLAENGRYCEICSCHLPPNYKNSVCPDCMERELFHKVKDYIRTHNVTEYDVAEHFHIPRQKVKQWIHDGRIEYKDESLNAIHELHCQKCGVPISFGTLCPRCVKNSAMSVHSAFRPSQDDGQMHFLERDRKK